MPDSPTCSRCQAALVPTARYCHRCGTRTAAGRRERATWIAAFVISAAFTAFIAVRARQMSAAPPPAMGGAAAPPAGAAAVDLSSMTPRERFDRLFDRVMGATERGDAAEAGRFTPMALMAFAQLDTVDQDARFHAALIHLASGDAPGALAQADSMQARDPYHLLALLVRTTAEAQVGNGPAAAAARSDFLAAWDAEIARPLPEYADHRPSLDTFRQSAP